MCLLTLQTPKQLDENQIWPTTMKYEAENKIVCILASFEVNTGHVNAHALVPLINKTC